MDARTGKYHNIFVWNSAMKQWSMNLYDHYEIGNTQTIHGAEQDVLILFLYYYFRTWSQKAGLKGWT